MSFDEELEIERKSSIPKISLQEAFPPSTLTLHSGTGKYFVTSAQNNTPVLEPFLKAVRRYCNKNNAQLVVLPLRYKNVSAWNANESIQWDSLLEPYFLNRDVDISDRLVLRGSARIAATASSPLSGWVADGRSSVFGHGQFGLKAVATPVGYLPHYLMSTGSITEPNFSNAKTSEIANFHHSIGGLLLTVHDDGLFDYEWVSWKDKGFYCSTGYYTDKSSRRLTAGDVSALVLGDWHGSEAPKQHKLDAYDLAAYLKPDVIVLHDVLSFLSESHHLTRLDSSRIDLPSVEDEFKALHVDLQSFKHDIVIVPSNHDRHVDRWLNSEPKRTDNMYMYHMTWALSIKHSDKSPFECAYFAVNDSWPVMTGDHTFMVKGVELGLHGDIGVNGSRGSIAGFTRISNKSNTGHGHAPEWLKGAIRQGTTGPIDPGYSKGYNSAALAHSVVYADGTRTLLSRVEIQKCKDRVQSEKY